MNQTAKIAGAVLLGALAVVAIVRIAGPGGEGTAVTDASRILACRLCGALNLVEPEMIRAQYDNNQVRPSPQGAVFTCPSCGKQGALVEVLNFDQGVVRCGQCGKPLLESDAEAKAAVRDGQAKLNEQGELVFYCQTCDGFFGRMVPRSEDAAEE